MAYIIGLLVMFGVIGWLVSGYIMDRNNEKNK